MFNRISKPQQNTVHSQEKISPPRMTLTVKELMAELHISKPTAYKLVREKGFPSLLIGERILIDRQGLQEWLHQKSLLPKIPELDAVIY